MDSTGIPTYAGLAPMLPVTDVARTIAFYESLGFRTGATHVPEGESAPVWAWLHAGRAHVMLNRAPHPVESTHEGASLWLYTHDVKGTHAELRSRGLDVGEIEYPFYNEGGEFHVHDPDGYAVFVAHTA